MFSKHREVRPAGRGRRPLPPGIPRPPQLAGADEPDHPRRVDAVDDHEGSHAGRAAAGKERVVVRDRNSGRCRPILTILALVTRPSNKRPKGPETPGPHVISLVLSARRTIAVRLFIFGTGPFWRPPGVRWTVFHRHLRPFVRRVHGDYGLTLRHATLAARHSATRHAAARHACACVSVSTNATTPLCETGNRGRERGRHASAGKSGASTARCVLFLAAISAA